MTAIEWLIEQCPRIETIAASSVIEQAKEMEKQQIIDALEYGWDNGHIHISLLEDVEEKYYNETYNK